MLQKSYHRKYFRTPFSAEYWAQAFSELKDTRSLVFAAVILALRIAMKPLKIPIAADVNITFGFIVNALGSMVYGPVVALLGGAVSDTLGYLVAPNGAYFFPFILLEMAGSFIFALYLWSCFKFDDKSADSRIVMGRNLIQVVVWGLWLILSLAICRVDNTFSFHYSTDGEHFFMMRFFSLPAGKKVRAGLLAQAPVGNGGARIYEDLLIENRTVKNIRFGV